MDNKIIEEYNLWSQLRFEQDGREIKNADEMSEYEILQRTEELKNCEKKNANEPNDWENIQKNCIWPKKQTPNNLASRMMGAIVGRFAGCTLGVPVEGYSIERMKEIADESGTPFPPTEYWRGVDRPDDVQYGVDKRTAYTLSGINGVPVDDDITYTVLNLILLERYGKDYSVEEVATLWKEILPYACTAEDSALKAIKSGVCALKAADGNPFIEWIGAAIRADAFGYVFAGDPMNAAKLCYNDAYLTHRRNGIYGEIFAAASVAAAFTAKTPLDAVKIGADCVPVGSRLDQDLKWALSFEGKLKDFREARALLDERFGNMNSVHTLNNMCAVVFAIILGEGDYTKSISQSVAMGLDNDCNGATVGSIVGANVGIENIPCGWRDAFKDEVRTYITGFEKLSLKDICARFIALYADFNK